MARVAVPYDDYVEGRMPPVCMISGRPTHDRFVLRVDVPSDDRMQSSGTMLGSLDRLLAAIDTRKPRRILLGRVPVDRDVWRRIRHRRTAWTVVLAAAFVTLVGAAWAEAGWSPLAAIAAIGLAWIAFVRRRVWKTALPRPHLTHGGKRVTLDGVHDTFAAAVAHGDL